MVLTNRSGQWIEDSYFYLILGAAAQYDELSLKIYGGDGSTQSFIIPAGATEFEVLKSELQPEIARDCEKVTLMYRRSDFPQVVYLLNTEYQTASGLVENVLPSPLHSNHAIVTGL